jgi:NAD(P)-dependent dehydrogenase (short-subunit alcohol dehydrogenase family)
MAAISAPRSSACPIPIHKFHEAAMALDVKGRTAAITGAGSGIGRAFALKAASLGMDLAIADMHAEGLGETERLARATGAKVFSQVVDVRTRADVEKFAADCFAAARSVALVFANAGVLRLGSARAQAAADWQLMIDVNVTGTANTMSAFLPLLVTQNEASRIVFTGSAASVVARAQYPMYCATKHAVWGMAESLHVELAGAGLPIGVSFLAPSAVRTGMLNYLGAGADPRHGQFRDAMAAHGMPPEEVADLTFAAALDGRFWIFPHPEVKALVEKRTARLVAEAEPQAD